MFNTGGILGILAGSMLGGGRRGGLYGRRNDVRIGKMMDSLYGDQNRRFKNYMNEHADMPMEAYQQENEFKPMEEQKRPFSMEIKSRAERKRDEEAMEKDTPPLPGAASISMPGMEEDTPPLPPVPVEQEEDEQQWFIEIPEEEVEDSIEVKAIRAMIAAAYADGELSTEERSHIEDQARKLPEKEAAFIHEELESPKPIEDFTKGVTEEYEKKLIFGLAVAVMKSDDKVQKSENKFAAELARALKLSKEQAVAIIKNVSAAAQEE